MTFRKKANKDLKDEVKDILQEKEEMRQKRLEAESEWSKDYEEQFRKDRQCEEEDYLANQEYINEPHYQDEPFPMD